MWTIVDISKDLSNPTRLTRLSVVFQLPLLVTGAKLAPVSMVLKNLLVHIMTQVTKQNDLLTTQLLGEGSANYGETFNIYIYIHIHTAQYYSTILKPILQSKACLMSPNKTM